METRILTLEWVHFMFSVRVGSVRAFHTDSASWVQGRRRSGPWVADGTHSQTFHIGTYLCLSNNLYVCSFRVRVWAGRGRENISQCTLIQNSKARNEGKQVHTTGTRTDFWACPFKSWFSASFFCNMNFLDKIQATQNISYIIQPPNFCWKIKGIYTT